MTQTKIRIPTAIPTGANDNSEFTPNGGRIPKLSGDIRHLIPRLGLREYWYPLCGVNRVPKKKAIRIRMLGEDLAVFRGKGSVYALTDICPHRGARLSEGDCHFDGTIACPYHGWVFDGQGCNVAVLSEGPNSIVRGKPGTDARSYPTKVIKGVVFVWMGDGEPAPVEEDVPEEFFRNDITLFFNDRIYWKTNWEVALENSMDSHVQYLHRDNLGALLGTEGVSPGGGSSGLRPRFSGNGMVGSGAPAAPLPGQPVRKQSIYPEGWLWPKHLYRQYWAKIFSPMFYALRVKNPTMTDPNLWVGGHHLPGMFRAGGSTVAPPQVTGTLLSRVLKFRGGASLFGLYTRQTVPVDEWLTRVWYHHSVVTRNWQEKAWAFFVYFTWGRWHSEYNFSQQDMSVMLHQVYDAPEKLSGTDAEVVQWRKLVVTKHFGGRNTPFQADKIPEPAAPPIEAATNGAHSGNGSSLAHSNGR
jgi:phenylpropionate dioxygenase-like ring-hydroxylating dioxygenase large terminal subunit